MSVGPIHLEMADQAARKAWWGCARQCAWVAGVFVAVVAVVMLVVAIREQFDTPLTPVQIDQLKRDLDKDPKNESIKETIRDIDQSLRQTYFNRRTFFVNGTWMLLGGLVVLTLSVKLARDLGAAPYAPSGPVPLPARFSLPMKIGMAAVWVVFAGIFIGMRMSPAHGVAFAPLKAASKAEGGGSATSGAANPSAASAALPSAPEEEMKKNWPNFRGAGALGYAAGEYPTQWDAAAGKNIVWKAAIPQGGKSSPVVWNDRVFVCGGADEKREVYCYDTASGKQLWATQVGKSGPSGLELNKDTTWSPSTPSTDGRRVFAIFPTGDLAAVNFDGTIAWSKNVGPLKTEYGHAASLLCWDGKLYVQLDQGEDRQNLSALYAFDCVTGSEAWKAKPRPVGNSWSTPVVVPAPSGPQLITLGNPWIIAYHPRTGEEIWRAKGLGGEVAPSPAFWEDTVIAAIHGADYVTIKTDGQKDVTKSHLKKIEVDALPDIVSPLVVGGKVLLVENKLVVCADARSGKMLWDTEYESEVNASPIAVGNRVYLTDKKGLTHVFDVAEQYKEIAALPMGQEICATPAFVNGRIYIRAARELFCIGQGGGK